MQKIGREVIAAEWWAQRAPGYAAAMAGVYHAHRLAVVRAMLADLPSGTALDFGCGEGVLLRDLAARSVGRVIGVEPEPALARRIDQSDAPRVSILEGGLDRLAAFTNGALDALLAINVLAFMTDAEEAAFYREAARLVRPGGALLVTHSNRLFDLFTLNAFTADFFISEFKVDAAALLARPTEPHRVTYNVRENPLAYAGKLRNHGFRETRQEFMNWHDRPPLLDAPGTPRMFRDTLDWPETERWKLAFQCSMFASLSTREPE
jgi:SAM-dependent methyltransferase